MAVGLSRSKPLSSEWALDLESFCWICDREFVPEVDLFTTRENHLLPQFVSPVPDHLAAGTDTFSMSWNQWNLLYLFPPASLILKVLALLKDYQGRAILVAPNWPNQAWYLVLLQKSLRHALLPFPVLSQRVGDETIFASSNNLNLLCYWSL